MKCRKILASLFSLGLVLSPMCVHADDTVVAESYSNGSIKTYSDYQSAWIAAQEGTIIFMMADWNLTDRLVVSENTSVDIVMNGHKIDRGLGDSREYGGEVIYLSKGASLTLDGDPDSNTVFGIHGFYKSFNLSYETVTSGGLVTGGASWDGAGGIHMKEGSSLVLNHVAISGNLSRTNFVGDGGAIDANNDNCTITMNDAIISYNASDKGGGIHVSGENTNIEMNNSSSIKKNYAVKYGGGIYSEKDATYVTMNTNSSISDNYTSGEGGGVYFKNPYCQIYSPDATASISNNESEIKGGGLYLAKSYRGDTARVEGITFDSNKGTKGGAVISEEKNFSIKNCTFQNNSGENGGAIYMNAENNTISNCTFEENSVSNEGGAIYNNEDYTTLQDCTIINNYAEVAGGGVYNASDVDITIQGKMIIKDNTRAGDYADNLMLDYAWYNFPYVMGEVSSDSCVGIRTGSTDGSQFGKKITSDGGKEFFLDDSNGYHIRYEDHKLYRESDSYLGTIFGNTNLGIAVIVMAGICVIGVVALLVNKKKNCGEA